MQIPIEILLEYNATTKEYKKGALIFEEGHKPRAYFQILSGHVKVFAIIDDCKEFIQGIFGEGTCFGTPSIFSDENYNSTAVAVEDSEIIVVPIASFLKMLDEHTDVMKNLLIAFARRIVYKSSVVHLLTTASPELRLLEFLKSVKSEAHWPTQKKMLIPYTRKEIAEFTGLRIETVIRALIKLDEEKKVEIVSHKIYF